MNPQQGPGPARGHWFSAAAGMTALVVYLATVAPGLTFAHSGTDAGDLIAAARNLGVPHPTGYPTYTMLAWLFTQLPCGNIAYRTNVMSVLFAATTVALFCQAAQHILPATRHRGPLSVAAALMLAFAPLFWSQAVITEVYSLLAFFASAILLELCTWRSGGKDRFLLLGAFTFGVGLGNHVTLALLAPPAMLLLWPKRRTGGRIRLILSAVLLLLAGLAVYAYLPLAAARQPPVNWGNPQTWPGFLWVVTAKLYQPLAFGLGHEMTLGRVSSWAGLVADQFGWWGLSMVLAGVWVWWHRDKWAALFGLTYCTLVGFYAFFYGAEDSEAYLLPCLMIGALLWAHSASYLLILARRLGENWRTALRAVMLLLPAVSLATHWSAVDLRQDTGAVSYIRQVLDSTGQNGLVIVRADQPTFALWYALYAEKQRADISVVNGPLLAYPWYQEQVHRLYPDLSLPDLALDYVTNEDLVGDLVYELIKRNLGRRPIYATDPTDSWRERFEFVRLSDAPLFRASGPAPMPER